MIVHREGHAIIFSDQAKQRIAADQCPHCGKPRAEWTRRKDWRCCSTECTNKFWQEGVIVKSWSDLRAKCFKRDHHTCKKCGYKPWKINLHTVKIMRRDSIQWEFEVKSIDPTDSSQLIADHIRPIALGGPEWDINNLQTLCATCNKAKTRRDMGKIGIQRQVDKALKDGQMQL